MKYVITVLFILLVNCSFATKVENDSVAIFFETNFADLEEQVNTNHSITFENTDFIHLLMHISGLNAEMICPGLLVTNKNIQDWKNWVNNNIEKIDYQFHIVYGLKLITQIRNVPLFSKLEETIEYLDAIFLELDKLRIED